jgi:nitroreductase
MDVHEAIQKRRSIRQYQDRPIPPDVLTRVLEAARRAPSWANVQSARWIVVTDPQRRQELTAALSPRNPATAAFAQAPVVLALCFVKGQSGCYQGQPRTSLGDWGLFDAGLAAANLTLAATAEGLGTVHVGATNIETAARILQIPDSVQFIEFIPLGYPADEGRATPRKELGEIISREKYGS